MTGYRPQTPARSFLFVGSLALATLLGLAASASATQPPRPGEDWPDTFREEIRNYRNDRSFAELAATIRANREQVDRGEMTLAAALDFGGVVLQGRKEIPVLPIRFANTPDDPYPVADLQQRLFDGPSATGTVADYYAEVSSGLLDVGGTVSPWRIASRDDDYYEGPPNPVDPNRPGCQGTCNQARTGDLLREAFDANDATIDFSRYDNDGPDGVPNSGDDDGVVDFVALVHPERGGECGNEPTNIWSHQWEYSGWNNNRKYRTRDAKHGGGFIEIDNYFVMPAVECNGTDIVSIGVFAHEFAHSFGLPDLYDTEPSGAPDSAGIGRWGLMAGGSWGADGDSPDRPVHLSAWSKEFLGWVNPTEVTSDLDPAEILDLFDHRVVFRIPVTPDEHFLVVNRRKKGFDSDLPGEGLLVWRIDEHVIRNKLSNNRVNADECEQGVELVEADGLRQLDRLESSGDAGDVFPGSTNRRKFDKTGRPRPGTAFSICSISAPGDRMTAQFIFQETCP